MNSLAPYVPHSLVAKPCLVWAAKGRTPPQPHLGGLDHLPPIRGHRRGDGLARQGAIGHASKHPQMGSSGGPWMAWRCIRASSIATGAKWTLAIPTHCAVSANSRARRKGSPLQSHCKNQTALPFLALSAQPMRMSLRIGCVCVCRCSAKKDLERRERLQQVNRGLSQTR